MRNSTEGRIVRVAAPIGSRAAALKAVGLEE